MAYIYLDDLKKILPVILDQWIDEDDESWEWIFQEIEQKCHVGKKKKNKYNKEEWIKRNRADIDALIKGFADLNKEVEEMHKGFIDTKSNVTQLGLSMKDMGAEINHIREDSKAAKSMAQTAKQRTEVDYSKYSGKSDGKINYNNIIEKSDADVVQEVYNRMAGRGASREELDNFRNTIHKYDALEKKEIQISCCNPNDKDCKTCKHYCNEETIANDPCIKCNAYQYWEAKENE